jgi:glycosyltransferase involved in cell wall biosynthesis
MDIFGGEVIPPEFVNQDGDPYLFALYRRWGASVFAPGASLRNTIGGAKDARYEKEHHTLWSFETLSRGVERVERWLATSFSHPPPKALVLDIVVPTFRCDNSFLSRIVRLDVPPTMSVMKIVICDNPPLADMVRFLERECQDLGPWVRVRVMPENSGASAARNRGIHESSADWILFLDDDVIPAPDILGQYEKEIRRHPNAAGVIGLTEFPESDSVFANAVRFSYLTTFYGVCRVVQPNHDLPWGVTANIVVRRCFDGIEFDTRFPKSGGGEDIDYCLRKKHAHKLITEGASEGFAGAELAKAVHPWWHGGARQYSHFYSWAKGDSELVDIFPQFTYRSAPNTVEIGFFWLMLLFLRLTGALSLLGLQSNDVLRDSAFFLAALAIAVLQDTILDASRHWPLNFKLGPWKTDEPALSPHFTGWKRLAAAAESCIVKNSLEVGHLVGHMKRRRFRNFARRFDWFAGRLPFVVGDEKRRAMVRFSLHVVEVAVLYKLTFGL